MALQYERKFEYIVRENSVTPYGNFKMAEFYQNDINTCKMKFTILKEGKGFSLEGIIPRICVVLPVKNPETKQNIEFQQQEDIEILSGDDDTLCVVEVNLANELISNVGNHRLQLQLYDEFQQTDRYTAQEIVYNVKKSNFTESTAIATDQYSIFQDLINKAQSTINAVMDLQNLNLEELKETYEVMKEIGDQFDEITENIASLEALKEQVDINTNNIADLMYKPLNITLNINPTIVEKGSAVIPSFAWTYNKDVIEQSFDGVSLGVSARTYTYHTTVNTNRTFTLTAKDERDAITDKSVSISFLNGKYYGVSSSSTYNSSFILELTKTLNESRNTTFTVNAGVGEHIFFAIPSRLGECSFMVGGFEGGFSKVATIDFANASGYTESYDIYKSTNANLGNTTVVVS